LGNKQRDNRKPAFYIGAVVKRLRKELGITQETLADRSKINRGHLSNIERNKSHPYMDTVFKLAKGLETTPEELTKVVNESMDFDSIFEDLEDKK
jgi:transcriptional regulator with XRE-family HTH domain